MSHQSSTQQLANMPINRLFFKMSIPIILGLLVSGLYNVVDTFFVTRVLGEDAIGGVQIIFPIQMLVFSISTLLGGGAASIIARSLGAKDQQTANQTLMSALFIIVIASLLITVLGLFFSDQLLRLIDTPEALFDYAKQYFVPTIAGTLFVLVAGILNDFLRAEGKVQFMMVLILIASLSNIIFDPIAIFVFDMGVEGVAYATVLAQLLAAVTGVLFYISGRTQLKLKLCYLKWPLVNIKPMVLLGLPTFLTYAGVATIILLANRQILSLADINNELYISGYGVVSKIYMFFVLPAVAMMIAFQTIAGFNYGARQYKRVHQSIVISLSVITAYGLLISLLMVCFPQWIIGLFTSDTDLLQSGIEISQRIFLGFSLACAFLIVTAYFQATGHAKPALLFSSAKMYAIQLPAILLLPHWWSIQGVWWSYPIADAIIVLLVSMYSLREFKRLLLKEHGSESTEH